MAIYKKTDSKWSNKKAMKAWAKASVVCIIASPLIFSIGTLLFEANLFERIGSKSFRQILYYLKLMIAFSCVAVVGHFTAFAILGIPIFVKLYPNPNSLLWKWSAGSITGAILGGVTLPLVFLEPDPRLAFIGVIYGMITAWACLLNRPDVELNAARPPDPSRA